MDNSQPRRVSRELSSQERQRLQRQQQQVAAELPDMIVRDQMRKDARTESTLSGHLRRAVHASQLSLTTIAEHAGIPPLLLDEFLTGERTLRSDVMDRLAQAVGYELNSVQ